MKQVLTLWLMIFFAGVANAQVEYPDVPLNDPAYADINHLSHTEVYHCFGAVVNPRAMTRYEFAVAVARFVQQYLTAPKEAPMLATFKKNQPESFAALRRLVVRFTPELLALGVNPEELTKSLQNLNTEYSRENAKFNDVPKGHWALPAVEALRKNGILVGYPAVVSQSATFDK